MRLPNTCKWLPEYTIWSHAPWGSGGKGKSIKALDLCGAYCCTACDAVVDGQAPRPDGMTKQDVAVAWFHGHLRSLVRLHEKGLLK